jgi:hypothetical protein
LGRSRQSFRHASIIRMRQRLPKEGEERAERERNLAVEKRRPDGGNALVQEQSQAIRQPLQVFRKEQLCEFTLRRLPQPDEGNLQGIKDVGT